MWMLPSNGTLISEQLTAARSLHHKDIFFQLGHTDLVEHSIATGDTDPIKNSYFCKSFWEKDHIEQEVAWKLGSGVFQMITSPTPVGLLPLLLLGLPKAQLGHEEGCIPTPTH